MPKKKAQSVLEKYLLYVRKNKYPNSVPKLINGIKSFLIFHDVDFNSKKLSKMYPPRKKPAGSEAYSIDHIRLMIEKAGSKRNKAVILAIATGGLREGAIPTLKIKHIINVGDCKLVIVYENEIEEYVTFWTPETSKAFDDYIESRKEKGEKITGESFAFIHVMTAHKRFSEYDKYNPMTEALIRQMMLLIIQKTKIDRKKIPGTVRHRIALVHGLRKFFDTTMNKAKVEVGDMKIPAISHNDIEKLMGHKNGMKGLYYDPENMDLLAEYKKAVPFLTVDGTVRAQAELEAERTANIELQQKLDEQRDTVREQVADILNEKLNELRASGYLPK